MKILHVLFIALTFSFACNAQDTLKINIKKVKEAPEIDSLISSLINYTPNSDELKKDSCLLLYLFDRKIDVGYVCSLDRSNQKQYITTFPGLLNSKNQGYFEFKGCLVFVCTDDSIKRFFIPTQTSKLFTFFKPKHESSLPHGAIFWTIFYKNGFFSWGVH